MPLRRLTVVTGVSGSGKSSLAFHTLYAEGQRRYVETFSAYARQFLDRMDRPDVDAVDNILPAVAIERSRTPRGSRSTVATLCQLLDHFKLLWSKVARLSCRGCGKPVVADSPGSIADRLQALPAGTRLLIGFELALDRKAAAAGGIADLKAAGLFRVWDGNHVVDLADDASNWPDQGEAPVVVDRVVAGRTPRARLVDSLETAFRAGKERLFVLTLGKGGRWARYSAGLRCAHCGVTHRKPIPNLFSFNSPIGACEPCSGFGRVTGIDWDLVIPLVDRSLAGGAIRPLEMPSARRVRRRMLTWCTQRGIPTDVPWKRLSKADRDRVIEGDEIWHGVAGWFRRLQRKIYKVHVRVLLARFRGYPTCAACGGARLGPEGRAWRVGGKTLPEVLAMNVEEATTFFQGYVLPRGGLSAQSREVVRLLFDEIRVRLQCLNDVGLSYLTLDRAARTLSGGEVQRVNLTAALGTHLVNTLFVLDEPSVGLHPRDNDRLVALLRRLCDQGNTVVVVEHDPAILKEADHVIDLGPGAGEHGGHVVAQGTPAQLKRNPQSVTGRWLAGRRAMPERGPRPTLDRRRRVGIRGARAHNLRNVDLEIALGAVTVLAGVSGSGKSTLAHDTLYQAMARALGRPEQTPGAHASVTGVRWIHDVVLLDQAAAGQTSRANAATYVGAWDGVRALFGTLPDAKARGYTASTFSFNVAGGRCERCRGEGRERVAMQFLSDVDIPCADCDGTRFQREVREVCWRDHSIADVMRLTATEAAAFFAHAPPRVARRIGARLQPLVDVGLGYLRLGQPLNTLSSGEWQRLRLAAALTETGQAKPKLYIFDEPTTGLHLEDVATLAAALHRLAARGHAVLVVEHQVDLMWVADRIVELGPGGGPAGGTLVADGPPEQVAKGDTPTAAYLREARGGRAVRLPRRKAPRPPLPHIEVRGARHHNLREVAIDVPRDRFVVVSGPSGSGKSTLAFDLLFAEGQRRYIDTLSAYARQFVGQLARPDVDSVRGIPPTVAIEQRRTRGGNRSTMATATEVSHFLRLLFARAGTPHCPTCLRPLAALSTEQVVERIVSSKARGNVSLLAPRILGRKGFHKDVFAWMRRRDLTHARVDGDTVAVDPTPSLDRYREHDIEAVVGAFSLARAKRPALRDAVHRALDYGDGVVGVQQGDSTPRWLSTARSCPAHGTTVPALDPRMFSHNSHRGWCPVCKGLGTEPRVNPDALPTNDDATLSRGGLPVLRVSKALRRSFLRDVRSTFGISSNTKWGNIDGRTQRTLLRGRKRDRFEGVAQRLEAFLVSAPDIAIDWFGNYVDRQPCRACRGARLRPEACAVRVGGLTLPDLLACTVDDFLTSLADVGWSDRERAIAAPVLVELRERAQLLQRMGLGYLTFDRAATTLSGGEAQRIRLAAQLGSNLRGACYVLDEPTIGLHPTDNDRLLDALSALRERGNSLIVVEHDLDTVRRADHVIDLGPGGGRNGGRIVAQGSPAALARVGTSPTGRVLARGPQVDSRRPRRPAGWLHVRGAHCNNLRGVHAEFPLECLTAVTGVSGAGKTSLVQGELVAGVRAVHKGRRERRQTRLDGVEAVERLVEVDAAPVGKTPRSVPATYLKIWDDIRRALAMTQEARTRGYGPGRFSFNVKAGRCAACDGRGEITVEMSFLPDVRVPCERCGGARFGPETLEIHWQGRSAADLLALTFEEAVDVFADHPKVAPAVQRMVEVGLGYLSLGQPTPTLSGGEAQRLKLVTELGRGGRGGRGGGTLYVLDEPTIGLHEEDVDRLLDALHRLVDRGNTVVVVEHDLGFVARCDHVLDLGPGAGVHGGTIVAAGTPRAVTRVSKSLTGRALRERLAASPLRS